MDIALPQDKIKYLEGQTQSLQFQLAQRSETTATINHKYEEMKQSLNEMNTNMESERRLTHNLTRDMTRQYKGMQDDLLNKINKRDNVIQDLTDVLQKEREDNCHTLEEKNCIIKEKEEHIKSLEDKMEQQCAMFAKMLQDAVEQMKERIEVQSASYDEKSVPIQHRLEEFKFNPSIASP
jgi:hypothetical protein